MNWDQFVSQLERQLGRFTVEKWIKPLKVIRFDAANLYLEAKDSFQIAWFEEHVRPYCKGYVNNNGRPVRIHITCQALKTHINYPETDTQCAFIASDRLDPELTWENFISESPLHAMAHNLIGDVAHLAFNPLFLHGPPGSGKTHLLMAATAVLRKQGLNAMFVRAVTFTEHVVAAIRTARMTELRAAYRSADALLVDDVHIFSKKTATQEEFFHTFNDLHTRNRPILLSSHLAPSKLNEIEPRLISRFEWGISIPLEKASWKAILLKKVDLWKLNISSDLIAFLIEHFPSSPLLALQALALRVKTTQPIDSKLASILLKDLLEKETQTSWTPETIIKAVAAHYGIRTSDILGKSQSRDVAMPRQVAMYICREKLKLPFKEIGTVFNRDHSTVMSSIRQTAKEIEEKNIDLLKLLRNNT